MTIDEARAYLTDLFKPEYHKYINTTLAGDFAVTLAGKFEEKNNKQMQTVAHDPCTGCANTIEDIPLFDCVACGKGSAD